MSINELQIIADFLSRAMCPEDVFGKLVNQEEDLKHSFRKLAKAVHPDLYVDSSAKELATKWFKELEKMRGFAEEAIMKGEYGKYEHRFPWKIPVLIKGKYVIESPFKAGQIADLFSASIESSKNSNVLLKIARNAKDNDLLFAEKAILDQFHEKLASKGAKDWPQTIPTISDSFLYDDGTSRRRINVMQNFSGFYSAEEIRKLLPAGVDGRTIVWMWKRLLVLMEWIDKAGIVHGAILPPHVMYYPDNDGRTVKDVRKHSVRLVDWCYAIDLKSRSKLSAWVPEYEDFYAPEILAKEKLGAYTDLYMGATTMLHLAGMKVFSSSNLSYANRDIPGSILGSILNCTEPNPSKRPQSIGKYFEEFTEIAKKEYGKPQYHDFILPA